MEALPQTHTSNAQPALQIEDDKPTTVDVRPRATASEYTPEQRERSQSSSVLTTPAAKTPTPQTEQTPQPRHEASESPGTPSRCRGTPRKLLTPSQVDAKIADILNKPLTKAKLNVAEELGNNYIFEVVPKSDPSKRIVKIGVTKGSEQDRLKRIKSVCQHVLVEDQQDDPEHVPVPFYFKVEKLIHAELYNFLYVFDCHCGDGSRSHGEYFDVDRATAQEIAQRWRRFCRLRPYGADGRLTPFWDYRLRNRNRRVPFESEESIYDHDKRRQRWERFANPWRIEMVVYDVVTLLVKIWRWKWQVATIMQSFYIAFLLIIVRTTLTTSKSPSTPGISKTQPTKPSATPCKHQRRRTMAELVQNMPEPLREQITAPTGGGGASCKPSCYGYLMRLPAACKVDHDHTRCVCQRAGDADSVRRYREAASVTDEGERRGAARDPRAGS
ncbi:hypothetical protein DL766_007177 [Monosporascus sp. MC13-8B]|nr:hypothetical protein DL766_007177 [Monosporascus sp. MC13-8B]